MPPKGSGRPPAKRFWDKVDKTATCWLWTGFTVRGYGRYTLDRGTAVTVHRYAYELLVGPIPEGAVLDHLCRNRGCVNPDHLEPVTNKENILRGVSFSARNAVKTHCPKGHEYTAENTRVTTRGWRECVICNRVAAKARNVRRRKRQSITEEATARV